MESEFISLTELGEHYGVTSHVVGQWLKDMGLRTDNGKPSKAAFDGAYVRQRPSRGFNTYFYVWHRDRTIAAIDRWRQ